MKIVKNISTFLAMAVVISIWPTGCGGVNTAPTPSGKDPTWVVFTGTSVQAVPNTGYLANSDFLVTITLPASLAAGDVVQVTGIGTGGWKIAQNAGQSVITKDIIGNIGAIWDVVAFGAMWTSVASSWDGIKLVTAANTDWINTSPDSGATWTARAANRNWISVASSSMGDILVAAVTGGQLYTSWDYGVTWIARDSNRNWISVASNGQGNILIAAVDGGRIYRSIDAGVNWTAIASLSSNRLWRSVAMSPDLYGESLIIAENGWIYTSINEGVAWVSHLTPSDWRSVAMSADGTKLVAVVFGGQIYTSSNSGVTWTPRDSNRNWVSVAMSVDGTRLAAVVNGGQIYTSINSGITWSPHDSNRLWTSVAMSSDGTKLIAVVDNGYVYRSIITAIPSTTTGITGSVSGVKYDAIELQYIGNNTFMVLSHLGYLGVQ